MKHSLKVDDAGAGKRIDVFVGDALTLSRAKVKALFEDGAVKLNGRRAKKGVMVAKGDALDVEVPEAASESGAVADSAMELRTLHVDDALVFVDKPAGVPTQPLKPGEGGTVANGLLAKFPEMASLGDDPREDRREGLHGEGPPRRDRSFRALLVGVLVPRDSPPC